MQTVVGGWFITIQLFRKTCFISIMDILSDLPGRDANEEMPQLPGHVAQRQKD